MTHELKKWINQNEFFLKSFCFSLSVILSFLCFPIAGKSQITINNYTTLTNPQIANALVDSLMGTGVTFSNPVFSGVRLATGYQTCYFTTTGVTQTEMGFSKGIAITTGNTNLISLSVGSNPSAEQGFAKAYTSGTAGELRKSEQTINDLNLLSPGINWYNAAILEFDFVPIGDSINFRYVFGGEEYSDNINFTNYQCSSYNDKFGFLISGPGISGGVGYDNNARNIARLANGAEVGINSVNNGTVGSSGGSPSAATCQACNSAWIQNTPSPEYNGLIHGTRPNGNTKPLYAAQGGLTPGATYHIKLLILDAQDATYDAIVYIEAGSFTSPTAQLTTTPASSTICSGSSTTLTATVNYGTPNFTYTWSDGTSTIGTTTNTASTTDQITVNPTTTTTYYVTVVDNNVPTPTTTTSSVIVTVTPLPTANISYSSSSYCNYISSSQMVTLTGTNAYTGGTYSAAPAGLSMNASGAIIPSSSTPGNYTITYTIPAAGGCGIVQSTTNVEITSPISQNITGVSQLCSGLTNTFTVSPTTGGTWSSSAPGIASVNSATGLVTGVSAGSAVITYTVTTSGGCVNNATQNITINSLPNVIANSNVSGDQVCSGGAVILTGSGANSYSWTGGVTNGVSFVPASTLSYVVTGTDNNSCQNTDQITITVNTLPDINVTGLTLSNPSACLANDGSITGITVTGSPVLQYVWNGGAILLNPDLTGVMAGVYNLLVTDGNGCVSSVGPYSLSDPGAPSAPDIDALTGPVCEGSSVTISINNPNGAATYSWTGPSGSLGTGSSITLANIALTDAGSYSAQTTLAGCTGSSSSVDLSVSPLPSATISYNDPFCSNIATIQSANLVGNGGGNFTSDLSGIDLDPLTGGIIPSASSAGIYIITYTIPAALGCSDVTSIDTVVITALPAAVITYPDAPFCSNISSIQEVNLNGTSGGTFNSTSGLDLNSSNGEILPSSSQSGSYTITYTIAASSGCPVVTSSVQITITEMPVASISYNGPFCSSVAVPQDVNLTGAAGGLFVSDSPGLDLDTLTGELIPVSSLPGNYNITYSISATGGCPEVNSNANVVINELPVASISYNGSPFCSNQTSLQNVIISGTTGGIYTSLPGLSIDSLTGSINPSLSGDGSYTVTYTIPASGGCPDVISSTDISIVKYNTPVTTFLYNTPVCAHNNNPLPIAQGVMTTGGTYSSVNGLALNSVTGEILLSGTTPGTYLVTYSVDANGCTIAGNSQASITINPSITPVTEFSYSIPVCADGSSPSPILVNGFTSSGLYSANPSSGLEINASTGVITLSASSQGEYTVTYQTQESGCTLSGSNSTLVVVNQDGCLNIPTAFSPNNDGANDTWEIEHIDLYEEVTLQIYNRWGQLMFEYTGSGLGYTDPKSQWDGTFNGKELPLSSFVFIVNLHNDTKPIQGIVTIIR